MPDAVFWFACLNILPLLRMAISLFFSLSLSFSIYMCMFSACFPVLLSVCMLHQQTDGQKDCHTISSICSSVCSSLCFFFSPVSNIGNICKFLRFTYRKNNVGLTFRILQNM